MITQKQLNVLSKVADIAAEESKGIRLKVGAVVTDSNGDIIAYGYNGTVNGEDNELENKIYWWEEDEVGLTYPYTNEYGNNYRLETKPDVIHAEQNVLMHSARRGISVKNGTMVITHSPCEHCTALMIQSGITDVYYKEKHRSFDATYQKYSHRINLVQIA